MSDTCVFYTHYIVAKQLQNFKALKNYVSVIFHCRITFTYECSRFERKAQKSYLIHTEILLTGATTPLI